MASLRPNSIPLYLRRLVPAALLAAAATVGGSAIGEPATACAVPGEWDIGQYDTCVHDAETRFARGEIDGWTLRDELQACCTLSGGILNTSTGNCSAPPAAEGQPGLPGVVGPGAGVATQPPPPPPVVRNPGVTQTFTPGPASQG